MVPQNLVGGQELLRRDRAHTAILTDFDGTLSAVVADHTAARPLPGADTTLVDLAASYGLVAVISGRPLGYLEQVLGHTGLHLSALYGLESWSDGERHVHPEAEPWRAVVADVVTHARSELPESITVEPKGFSLTLHYRSSPELRRVVEAWARDQAASTGLLVHEARQSVELNPPVAADKGTAIDELLAGADVHTVCFLGDDKGDLPAFAALDRLAGRGLTTLKVAVTGPEAPPEMLAAGDLHVDGPEGALAFLQSLLP